MQSHYAYDEKPTMFRARPVAFVFLCVLIPLGIGALALLAWYLGTLANRLTIDTERNTVVWRNGLLSKRTKQISISKLRGIEVDQTFIQRMTDAGRISLYTTGDLPEISLANLPRPNEIKLILSAEIDTE